MLKFLPMLAFVFGLAACNSIPAPANAEANLCPTGTTRIHLEIGNDQSFPNYAKPDTGDLGNATEQSWDLGLIRNDPDNKGKKLHIHCISGVALNSPQVDVEVPPSARTCTFNGKMVCN